VTYALDKTGRLQSLTDWASRLTSYTYWPDGSLATATAPNGTVTRYSYDHALRLTEVLNEGAPGPVTGQLGIGLAKPSRIALGRGQNVISRHRYTLDAVGNRTQLDEVLPQLGVPGPGGSVVSTSYGYDRLSQLTSVTPPGTATSYTYDPVGNRLTMVRGSSTGYTYDRADRILTAGATSYTLNANGNTTARGSDSFGYDQANRLVSATISGATSTYVYDGDGKRASKTVAAVTTSYVYDVNRGLPVLLDDGTRNYLWGLGLAYAVESGGAIGVYHSDGLGSVRALSDESGTMIAAYQTDEFGVPTVTQGSSTQPFEYTGEQRDGDTGLIYLRGRTYDPTLGRLVQRDPLPGTLDSSESQNRYAYALNNPILYTDPTGLWTAGVCVQGSYGGGNVFGSVSICPSIASNGEIGIAVGSVTGVSSAAALVGVGIGPQVSNSSRLADLELPETAYGGSIRAGGGIGWEGGHAVLPSGELIVVSTATRDLGINLPYPTSIPKQPFLEGHVGQSPTVTVGVNIPESLDRFRRWVNEGFRDLTRPPRVPYPIVVGVSGLAVRNALRELKSRVLRPLGG
jgi:RHS repeat-associated protein